MNYKGLIPLGDLFERFLQLEKIDNVKDINEILMMLKYDPILKDKFEKFCEQLREQYQKKQK